MALLNFPTPGSIGEQTTQNGNTWQWNGTSWVAFNSLSLSSQVTGILAVQYGGTGFGGTYTKGDLLYASSSNTFTKLAAGTAGSVLASSGPGGDLYWKLDAQGAGTVGSGTANELTYYDTTTSVTSSTGITFAAGTKLTIGLGTSSTSTTTGAFIVYGGVGIGGSLWTGSSNYSSISGVGHLGGAITSGVWSGTAISLSNGGTNGTRSGNGVSYQLAVYNTSGTAITQINTSASIANSILLQSTELAYPIWVSQSSLSVGFATSSTKVGITSNNSSSALPLTFSDVYQPYAALGSTITISAIANTGAIVATTFIGNLGGTAVTATNFYGSLSGLATSSTKVGITSNNSSSALPITFSDVYQPYAALGSTITISAIANTGAIVATTFIGNHAGTAATFTNFYGSLSGLATSSTKVGITSNNSSSALPLVFSDVYQPYAALGSTITISAIANTGAIVATTFIGNLSGTAVTATHYGSGINLTGIVTSLAAGNAIAVTSSTGAITVGNTGVLSLQGTANQVLVNGGSGSATTGAITLTTPQNIGTGASVTFANLTLSDGTYSSVATVGSQPTSMVNKQYVDNLASGLDIHGSVRLIQTGAALGASYVQTQSAGSAATSAYLISTTFTTLPAIDGITISAIGITQRVLVNGGFTGNATIGGTTAFTPANSNLGNGIYYVAATGAGGTNWMLIRATDTDDNTELTGGTFTFVEEGNTYADSGWVCSNDTTNNGAITLGSTAITFTQFTGGGALSVGQGLSKVGNTLATNANIASAGSNFLGKWDTLAIGGAVSGVAGTGFYPTFQIATGTSSAATATLTIQTDGFSLIGGTSSSRMLTVTGSGITLTGGGFSLTLTGSISLPAPTANGIAYGASSSTVAFLTAGGSGASVLTQTTSSAPVYLGQSQLIVGGATTAASLQGGNQYQIPYQSNSNTTSFITLASGSGASILTQTNGAAPVYIPQSQLVAGSATYAIQASTGTTTAINYLIGTLSNTASSGGTSLNTGFGITIGNNYLTSGGIAVTNLTGATSTSTGALIVSGGVGIGSSLWTSASYFSSISGVGISNGVVLSGVWSGTAISLANGGTNGTRSGNGVSYQLAVYNSTGTAITQIGTSSSIANSILFQSTELAYPTWVSQNSLIVGGATTAGGATTSGQVSTGTTTATNYLIGTLSNTASSGGTSLNTGFGITIGNNYLTSGAIAVTNLTGAISTSTGALIVSGGVGIGSSLWTSASYFSSISGLGISNGVVLSGTWSGTAITTFKGGTGLITVNPNQVLIGASTGNTWTAIGSSNIPVVGIGTVPPSSPGGAIGNTQSGQLWWDSTYGVLKVYYNDGDTSQWVDATPVLGSSGGGSAIKRSYLLSFGAGFTPSTGADTVSVQVPYAPDNSSQYYYIKRLDYRHETAGTGVSFYIERHNTGNASFSPSVRIHTAGSGAGASFVTTGAGIFITSYTLSSTGASFISSSGVAGSVISGDYLRLNFTAINSVANMSISMIIEEQ